MIKDIIEELSKELGLPEQVVVKAYKVYWKFIKDRIEELPLKDRVLDEEVFNKTKKSFNIAGLGKLYCFDYATYSKIVSNYKRREENDKSEKSQTNG